MIFRLSGAVSEVGSRDGVSKKSGEPYSIPYLTVGLSEFAYTTVNLADNMVGKFAAGDVVDLIVQVEAAGGYLRAQATGVWPSAAGQHRPSVSPVRTAG